MSEVALGGSVCFYCDALIQILSFILYKLCELFFLTTLQRQNVKERKVKREVDGDDGGKFY